VGVREQRKQQTRQRIAETALQLFVREGFDKVTVAQVAQAAGVTEKTVFNHFDTKEDLVYSQDDAFQAAMLEAIRARAAGESVLAAAERFLLDRYQQVESSASRHRARTFASLVAANPALQARERHIHARYADALCDLIAEEQHAAPDDLRPRITAEVLLAVHRGTIAAMRRALLHDIPDAELAERVITSARRGFRFLASGMARYAARR
jgi:AcrR family transcriptional regulator